MYIVELGQKKVVECRKNGKKIVESTNGWPPPIIVLRAVQSSQLLIQAMPPPVQQGRGQHQQTSDVNNNTNNPAPPQTYLSNTPPPPFPPCAPGASEGRGKGGRGVERGGYPPIQSVLAISATLFMSSHELRYIFQSSLFYGQFWLANSKLYNPTLEITF